MLAAHGAAWRERFVARRKADEGAAFSWPQHDNTPLNEHLLPTLLAMTAGHCAYCDHFELGVDGARATIDHFCPKGDRRFWEDAFAWENLYPCCDLCQQAKGETYRESALRPDAPAYDFDRFFIVNFRTGEVAPSPLASAEDQQRARETIAWLGLNRRGLPARRRDWYARSYAPRRWFNDEHAPLDELPYRSLAPVGSHPLRPIAR